MQPKIKVKKIMEISVDKVWFLIVGGAVLLLLCHRIFQFNKQFGMKEIVGMDHDDIYYRNSIDIEADED